MSSFNFFPDYFLGNDDDSYYPISAEQFNTWVISNKDLSEDDFNATGEEIKNLYHSTILCRLIDIQKHSPLMIISKENLNQSEQDLFNVLTTLLTLNGRKDFLPTLIQTLDANNQSIMLSHMQILQKRKRQVMAEARARNAKLELSKFLENFSLCYGVSLFNELSARWNTNNGTFFEKAQILLDDYLSGPFNSLARHHCIAVAELKKQCETKTINTEEELILALTKIENRNPEGHLQATIAVLIAQYQKQQNELEETRVSRRSRSSLSFNSY